MSFTANTSDWSLTVALESRRWHLKEKLLLEAQMSVPTRHRTLPKDRDIPRIFIFDILDSDASFDTPYRKAAVRRRSETGDYTRLPF